MSAKPRPPLFVVFRPMVEVGREAVAVEASAAMQARLEALPGVVRVEVAARPRLCRKIEGTWEVTFHLHPGQALAGVFAAVIAFAPSGWTGDFAAGTPDGARWAVWNRPDESTGGASGGVELLLPSVVWAELGTWDGVVSTGPFESADG